MFFFFKQNTAYEMLISDWSADVCSSDLVRLRQFPGRSHSNAASSVLLKQFRRKKRRPMLTELELCVELRARAFRARRPIGIIRLRRRQSTAARFDPQTGARRHQLLQLAEAGRNSERIAACNRVPKATLIIIAVAAEDLGKPALAIVLSANDPVHGLAKLQDRAETGDRIDADARAGKRARFPCLAIIVTNVVKRPVDVDTFKPLISETHETLL